MIIQIEISDKEEKALMSLYNTLDVAGFMKQEIRTRIEMDTLKYGQQLLAEVEIIVPADEIKDVIEGYQSVPQEIKDQINDLLESNQP